MRSQGWMWGRRNGASRQQKGVDVDVEASPSRSLGLKSLPHDYEIQCDEQVQRLQMAAKAPVVAGEPLCIVCQRRCVLRVGSRWVGQRLSSWAKVSATLLEKWQMIYSISPASLALAGPIFALSANLAVRRQNSLKRAHPPEHCYDPPPNRAQLPPAAPLDPAVLVVALTEPARCTGVTTGAGTAKRPPCARRAVVSKDTSTTKTTVRRSRACSTRSLTTSLNSRAPMAWVCVASPSLFPAHLVHRCYAEKRLGRLKSEVLDAYIEASK